MRDLDSELIDIQTHAFRLPEFKLFVYDIVSTRKDASPETMGRIVAGDPLISDPLDLSDFVLAISKQEVSSDFLQGTLAGDSLTFQVADKNLTYDPVGGSESRWLRPGNVVRVHEGEKRAESYVNETFNGTDVGVNGTYSVAGRDIVRAEDVVIWKGSIGGTLLELDTDYSINEFDGTITGLGSEWVAATDYYVTYDAHAIPVQDWPITFTGTISGRAGADERDRNNNATLQVTAVDRMAAMLKITTTSAAYPQGTSYQEMMRALLEDDVGMSADEFDLLTVGQNNITSQVTTQLVDESPVLSIAKIAFVDGFVPRFRGDGVLTLYPTTVTNGPNVIYEDLDLFTGFARPFNPVDGPNQVEVLGLSAEQTRIEQPRQVIATANLTLGFFGGDASILVKFSDDGTQQASNTDLNAISSVTGALIPFGAEDWNPIFDNDNGVRSGRIDVAGAFYAPLVTTLYASRIAASYIPDTVVVAGIGASTGSTISVGRIIEGVAAIAIALVQATIGRGDYEILGCPYEYVFEEIRRVARVADVPLEDRRSVTVENHLLDNDGVDDEVQEVANRELIGVRKRQNTYVTTMRHDLRLEPYDKFRLPDGREFIISSITRTMSRGDNTVATLQLFETTLGVFP